MAQRNRTIPDDDSGIVHWVRAFSAKIAADPAAYGFTQDDADLLTDLAAELTAKYITARRAATRTRPNIRAKNECRKDTLDVFRSYVRRVSANPDLSNPRKLELGIVLRQSRHSPLPAPQLGPDVWVRHGAIGVHDVGYRKPDTFGTRAKPRGVSHMVLLCAIGEKPVNDPAVARYVGAFTRWPIRVRHEPRDSGKVATYFGAWVTGSGGQSAWSSPVSLVIALGAKGQGGVNEAQLRAAA